MFLYGFRRRSYGVPVFLHVLRRGTRKTCVFALFSAQELWGSRFFTCFKDRGLAKHVFLHGFWRRSYGVPGFLCVLRRGG